MTQPRSRALFRLVPRLVVTLGVVTYLVWRSGPEAVWSALREADAALVAFAVALVLLGVAVSTVKWWLILRARHDAPPVRWLFGTYLVGQLANNLLPTTVGGDAVRTVQLGRRLGSYAHAGVSVFIERLTGFLALTAIVNVALLLTLSPLTGSEVTTSPALGALAGAMGVLCLITVGLMLSAHRLRGRLGRVPARVAVVLDRIAEAFETLVPRGRLLAGVLALSIAFQSLVVAVHWACAAALDISAPLALYALIAPMSDLVALVPVFINGLGARELVFALYLPQVGVPDETAIALAFLVFLVRLVVSLLGAGIILARRPRVADAATVTPIVRRD